MREELCKKSKHAGYFNLTTADVKSAIFGHAEFAAFKRGVDKLFTKWKKANSPLLKNFGKDDHRKAIIETLSGELLAAFTKEQVTIEKLETDIAALEQQMEEMAEEHGGDKQPTLYSKVPVVFARSRRITP